MPLFMVRFLSFLRRVLQTLLGKRGVTRVEDIYPGDPEYDLLLGELAQWEKNNNRSRG